MINSVLWKKIESFDLDKPMSEYGFSTRLAKENAWTQQFTSGAITEYKKFMFLAATSEFMISPSEVVDVVWHQHLVFTQSYTELCNLLGRKIEHLPSTRNKDEFEKFKRAKDRTSQYYTEVFGTPPATYWYYTDMYEPLGMKKSAIKIRTFLVGAVLAWVLLLIPACSLLKPLYININGPLFLASFLILSFLSFGLLELFNRATMDTAIRNWSKDSFAFKLSAMELVYLKNRNLDEVIHGYINHMVDEDKIEIGNKNSLSLVKKYDTTDAVEFIIATTVDDSGEHGYRKLIAQLKLKPALANIAAGMDEFKKYINKSVMFFRLFVLNCITLGTVLLLAMARLLIGMERNKPVGFLFVMMIAFVLLAVFYLARLSYLLTGSVLPSYYTENVIPEKPEAHEWDWNYYLLGAAVLTAPFIPVYKDFRGTTYSDGGGSSGGSCGSGCGSSCGGGCGGCGGG